MAKQKSSENYFHLRAVEMKDRILRLIQSEMDAKQMNATAIAKKLGIPSSSITRILKGDRGHDPKLIHIVKICLALEIQLDHILKALL